MTWMIWIFNTPLTRQQIQLYMICFAPVCRSILSQFGRGFSPPWISGASFAKYQDWSRRSLGTLPSLELRCTEVCSCRFFLSFFFNALFSFWTVSYFYVMSSHHFHPAVHSVIPACSHGTLHSKLSSNAHVPLGCGPLGTGWEIIQQSKGHISVITSLKKKKEKE